MKKLHVVSFTIPWPPDYGGVIDVYYKLKALKEQGAEIILHAFKYDRQPAAELETLCEKVFYYERKMNTGLQLSVQPFIVSSRKVPELLKNLAADPHPVLFEGLHTCGYLNAPALKNKLKIYRESNIEHRYYRGLAAATAGWKNKLYFHAEALRLHRFQRQLKAADIMLPVSYTDAAYLKKVFPGNDIIYLPSFHGMNEASGRPGRGSYILFHGNLSVAENDEAARWLMSKVFRHLPLRCVVAGKKPSAKLLEEASRHPLVEVIPDPDAAAMDELIANAQVNVLVTLRPAGLKLKLINALYKGRFCVANHHMLKGTGLEETCSVAHSAADIRKQIMAVAEKDWNVSMTAARQAALNPFHDRAKAGKLITLISTANVSGRKM